MTTIREFIQAKLDETNVALSDLVLQRDAIPHPLNTESKLVWDKLQTQIRPLQSRKREMEMKLRNLL